ncbi:MAG: SDR family oxidoreductase, partial [Cyanobacteria bacterium P01_A01_bin.135]
MDLQLTDKLALITGSTAGIGYAIAEALAAEGASVILNGRSQGSVDAAIAKLSTGVPGKVLGFAGDLSTTEAAAALVEKYPNVEILVNNLGIFEATPFDEITDDDWRRFFEINVLSGVRLSRLYLPSMKARNWGRIVFISSESGVQIP